MPIYFQKISDKNFDPDGDFFVKDSKGCNITAGVAFFIAFALIVSIDQFNIKNPSIYQLLYFSIIPGVYLVKRGLTNRTIITVNRKGFYYFEELVTNWDNFIDAAIRQDEENRSYPYDLSDRFMLFVRYGKFGHENYFGRKFLLTAVMDKSEEEIMAAIKFYYEHREPGKIIPYSQIEKPAADAHQHLLEPPEDKL